MVEQIRISPEEVRGYGNICEEHSLDDFIVSSSGLAKEKENIHGALTEVYKLVYSLYGLIFSFDKGNKQLYLHSDNDAVVGFSFSEKSLVFNTVSHISFAFADKELVVDDEYYLFVDYGVSSNYTDWSYSSNMTIVRTDAYSYTQLIDSTVFGYVAQTITSGDTVEADVCSSGLGVSSAFISIRKGTTSVGTVSLSNLGLRDNEWGHMKLILNGTSMDVYCNGVFKTTKTLSVDDYNRIQFSINANATNTHRFKNFVIY